VTTSRSAYAAGIVRLYLNDPDTPIVPTTTDWDIAADLFNRGIPLEKVAFAFKIVFIRRRQRSLPPILSLAYFRTVALNLTVEETQTPYMDYIDHLYERQQKTKLPRFLRTGDTSIPAVARKHRPGSYRTGSTVVREGLSPPFDRALVAH